MTVKLSQRLSADLRSPLNCFYQKFSVSLKLNWKREQKTRSQANR